ncbi:hypothetical protein H4582DRAFT_2053645 [Lactarius indigo]|nr:hypothetical protein H4582DRAFT_2053645 [Lactarius indigo]
MRNAGRAPGNCTPVLRCFHEACWSVNVRSKNLLRARALDGAVWDARMSRGRHQSRRGELRERKVPLEKPNPVSRPTGYNRKSAVDFVEGAGTSHGGWGYSRCSKESLVPTTATQKFISEARHSDARLCHKDPEKISVRGLNAVASRVSAFDPPPCAFHVLRLGFTGVLADEGRYLAYGDGRPGGWSALTVYADTTVRGMYGYYHVYEGTICQGQGNEVAVCRDK